MKKSIVISVVIILICIVILIIYKGSTNIKYNNNDNDNELNNLLKKKVKYGKLLLVNYSNSGDMNGNIDSIEIDTQHLLLISKYSSGLGENIIIEEYNIMLSDIELLENKIKEYNFIAWDDLPLDPNRVPLDASTPNLNITYDNSSIGGFKLESYSISFYDKIPEDGYKLLDEFVDYLYSLKKEENLINTYEEEW